MATGERKSSEDLIREAHQRLGSLHPHPDADVLDAEAGVDAVAPPGVASQPPTRALQYRSQDEKVTTTFPPDPIERRVATGIGFSGRWVGWAITALVFSAWGLFTSLDDANRDGSGEIVAAGDLDVMTLQVGDCFDDPEVLDEVVFDVAAVPCTDSHDNEVFAVQSVSAVFGGAFPGLDALEQHGYEVCSGQTFDSYVGASYLDSALEVFTITPTEESWDQGDREIVCALFRLDFAPLTGSARGSGL
jgi:hypothetical protein